MIRYFEDDLTDRQHMRTESWLKMSRKNTILHCLRTQDEHRSGTSKTVMLVDAEDSNIFSGSQQDMDTIQRHKDMKTWRHEDMKTILNYNHWLRYFCAVMLVEEDVMEQKDINGWTQYQEHYKDGKEDSKDKLKMIITHHVTLHRS